MWYQFNIEILFVGIILRNVFKYKNYIMKYVYICLHKLYDELIEKYFEQYITSNSFVWSRLSVEIPISKSNPVHSKF